MALAPAPGLSVSPQLYASCINQLTTMNSKKRHNGIAFRFPDSLYHAPPAKKTKDKVPLYGFSYYLPVSHNLSHFQVTPLLHFSILMGISKSDSTALGIPGDGRCLFRSVVHGACLRSGKPSPTESLEKELADELRSKVADEFIKRRGDTEWFLEDDFDTYVRQMRQPHVWGGEPELLMASHVLKVPITVYMRDRNSGGLKIIAEYGQEYGRENPICVLYHGYGHYDALRRKIAGSQSKQFLRWISGGLIHQGYKAEGEKMLIV
ncbi:OVARIAN TUMOR DOMAIN-containing deubiquitinating enzyme 4 isoform X2 [Manihot esculenta]|uniref:Ubiquitin thioesterase OTU n=2 Tax=Manihot esculenta TaxID=3983 RepID=A0A2C9UN17_MANES|nr:OVARIAN TUMOR DOMAIN-containing deubiquitinating enzyme 4 isoform X2 [Manihot esculenta]OAY32436.1 hypothetical protein MANES_13G017300v8 [Manihot esculenta]